MENSNRLVFKADLHRQVLSYALMARPKEAVGLLGGSITGLVGLVLPLTNIAVGNTAFVADPFSQYCALRRLQIEKQQLLAIYHSHPGGGITPSVDDLVYAKRWPCAHVIVSIPTSGESNVRLRAFHFDKQGRIEDVEVRLLSTELEL